jgi:hypothetical protein
VSFTAPHPHATVAKVMATSPLNVFFRRVLVDNNVNAWNNLVAQLVNVEIGEGSDTQPVRLAGG